jgi:hypothetical protein
VADNHDAQTEAAIKTTLEEVKANFPWISDASARTVAEDQVLRGVPAHESELVDEERNRRANQQPG